MISNKRIIAIIPARSGSKGLPGKNIMPICGKPLVAWSIEQAKQSRYLDTVLVSTDSENIANIAHSYGAETPFLRPIQLATDTATSVETAIHALDFCRVNQGKTFDYLVLLEPTSPLREPQDIDNMLEKLLNNSSEYDALVSIGAVHEHPSIMKKIIGNSMQPFCEGLGSTGRRQDNAPAYFPYGVAYIVSVPVLYELKTFYPPRTTHYEIKRYQCYEIDDIYDFLSVEALMRHEWELI